MKLKRNPVLDKLVDQEFINDRWEVIQDWHQHEFSDITNDEIRVLFNTYTGERKIETRGAK